MKSCARLNIAKAEVDEAEGKFYVSQAGLDAPHDVLPLWARSSL